jgi:hypothetical protein
LFYEIWVFLDKRGGSVVCYKHLANDMDGVSAETERLFYLNDSTWWRLADMREDDCNVHLQVLHL